MGGRVWRTDYANPAKATNDTAHRIVVFYSSIKLQLKLGNSSPYRFRA